MPYNLEVITCLGSLGNWVYMSRAPVTIAHEEIRGKKMSQHLDWSTSGIFFILVFKKNDKKDGGSKIGEEGQVVRKKVRKIREKKKGGRCVVLFEYLSRKFNNCS